MFSLEKKWLQEELLWTYECINGACKKHGERLLSGLVVTDQGFKLKDSSMVPDTSKKSFRMRMVRQCNKLLRVVVDASSLEVFVAKLHGAHTT